MRDWFYLYVEYIIKPEQPFLKEFGCSLNQKLKYILVSLTPI